MTLTQESSKLTLRSDYQADQKEFIEMKMMKALGAENQGLEEKFERIMADLDYLENKVSEFRESSEVQKELDLIDDLLLAFKGTFKITEDPEPAMPVLKKSSVVGKQYTEYQAFLSDVLFEEKCSLSGTYEHDHYSSLFQKIEKDCQKLQDQGLKELENDLLELRYYGSTSEMVKRIKHEINSNAVAESVMHEPSLFHKQSRSSLLSDGPDIDEPMLGKHKLRLPSMDMDDIPVLTKLSSGNKGAKKSTSILLEFIVIIQEINLIYLQAVSVILEAQKSDIGKLAVYCLLVGFYVDSVAKIPSICARDKHATRFPKHVHQQTYD